MRKPVTPRLRVAIYGRTATPSSASLDLQVVCCTEAARKNGWRIVAIYLDDGCAGAGLEGRVGFFEMMSAAVERKFDVLLVDRIDRIARDLSLNTSVSEVLERHGVAVATASPATLSSIRRTFIGSIGSIALSQQIDAYRRPQRRQGTLAGALQ